MNRNRTKKAGFWYAEDSDRKGERMLRKVLAVIAGYIAMALVVFISLTVAYLALGAGGSFQPGTYAPSTIWLVVMFILGLIAAIVGGAVCRLIGRTEGAVSALILVILALGALQVAFAAMAPAPAPEDLVRTGDVSTIEAMQKAQTPMWTMIANPILGAVGAYVGGRVLVKGRASRKPEGGEE